MNYIDEQWLNLPGVRNRKNSIVAISNTGKCRRSDGNISILSRRYRVWCCGKLKLCSRIIAENFLITVRRPDQVFVDHITHTPTVYAVNDVRNLRWCTNKENSNFEEAKEHYSIASSGENNPMYGRTGDKHPMYGKTGEKAPSWKGDDVGPSGAYQRAKKLYESGDISEEEFQTYRYALQEYRRAKRSKSSKTA